MENNNLNEGVADLHVHTVTSDGTDTLRERVEQAANSELDAVAITDHDRISDELTSRFSVIDGVTVITGVEVRADVFDTKVEILGYYVNPEDSPLNSVLQRARSYRRERNRKLIEELTSKTPLDTTHDEITDESDGILGRPHLAKLLVDEGIVEDVGEAFREYLGEEGRCYVPMERVPHEDVLDAVHSADGIGSLAHPGRMRVDPTKVREIVEKLVGNGLDGIEVWYPYSNDTEFGVDEAYRAATRYGLVRTGGSDCHGSESSKFRIGDVRTPQEEFTKLRSV